MGHYENREIFNCFRVLFCLTLILTFATAQGERLDIDETTSTIAPTEASEEITTIIPTVPSAEEPLPFYTACKWILSKPNATLTPCPRGTIELFRDINSRWTYLRCCNKSHYEFPEHKDSMYSCETTSCTDQTSNPCSAADQRFINEGQTHLEYEEIIRNSCNDGEGASALCCIKNSTESLLVSALGAEINEFPHQAKLRLPTQCGGTVYNSRFIITAAHCVVDSRGYTKDPFEMRVSLGTNNGARGLPGRHIYRVKRVIVHPEYGRLKYQNKEFTSGTIFNDIALLELGREVEFGDEIKALKIAPKGFNPFEYADKTVIVGWGTTDTLEVSHHLQKANFILRNDTACFVNGKWKAYKEKMAQLLCVGGILDGKWSPTAGGGDSGGPAICKGPDGTALLCGITSFGGYSDEDCNRKNDEVNCPPSVYADVGYFHDWIKMHAGHQNESHLYRPILYGESIKAEEAPHQVEIRSTEAEYPCGGTLIAPNIVVAAAHCVAKSNSNNKWERLKNLRVISSKLKYEVEEMYVLPGFVEDTDDKFRATPENKMSQRPIVTDSFYSNNLAVLKIYAKIPLPLPNLRYPILPSGENVTFGSGIELAIPRNSTYYGKSGLVRREFKILEHKECQTRISRMTRVGSNITIDTNLLCGVERYSGGSLCDRSLGGGLICKGEGGADILCGVQVFRFCEFSFPNAFLNVGLYAEWIEKVKGGARRNASYGRSINSSNEMFINYTLIAISLIALLCYK